MIVVVCLLSCVQSSGGNNFFRATIGLDPILWQQLPNVQMVEDDQLVDWVALVELQHWTMVSSNFVFVEGRLGCTGWIATNLSGHSSLTMGFFVFTRRPHNSTPGTAIQYNLKLQSCRLRGIGWIVRWVNHSCQPKFKHWLNLLYLQWCIHKPMWCLILSSSFLCFRAGYHQVMYICAAFIYGGQINGDTKQTTTTTTTGRI